MSSLSNFIFTAEIIVPLLILMLGGYVVKRMKMIDDKTATQCNTLVFKLFLPISIFNSVRKTTISEISYVNFFIFAILCVLISFLVISLFVWIIEKDNSKRGVMIQGICRSNYAIFGIPIVTLLNPNADTGLAAMLVAIAIPLYNVLSILVLTVFGKSKLNIKNIVLSLIKNPLIIATFFGGIMLILSFDFPLVINRSLDNFALISTPLGLFVLGAKFDFSKMKEFIKQLTIICLGRLVVLPIISITIAILLGYRDMALTCLMVLFCAPTAGSTYIMSLSMGGDGDLAASSVVLTTILSVFTMFIAIYILNGLNLISN